LARKHGEEEETEATAESYDPFAPPAEPEFAPSAEPDEPGSV